MMESERRVWSCGERSRAAEARADSAKSTPSRLPRHFSALSLQPSSPQHRRSPDDFNFSSTSYQRTPQQTTTHMMHTAHTSRRISECPSSNQPQLQRHSHHRVRRRDRTVLNDTNPIVLPFSLVDRSSSSKFLFRSLPAKRNCDHARRYAPSSALQKTSASRVEDRF